MKSEGLIIVGATNRPDQIHDAIKRSGRLETHIEIPISDVATLAAIFMHHLGDDAASLVRDIGADKVEVAEMDNEADDMAGEGTAQ